MLREWIEEQCFGMASVAELGCGFGTNLAGLPVAQRVGIDIFQPYLDKNESQGATLIQGDMKDMAVLPELQRPSLALLIDVVEHLYKVDALQWLTDLKGKFDRIAIQTPLGFHAQNEDIYEMGGDEYQTHRSGWQPEELFDLGFRVQIVPDYHEAQAHKGSTSAIFAVYDASRIL